jgi:hypothetical protein
MKSLRQVLTECTEPQLEQIAGLWGLGNGSDKRWSQHRARLEQGMRDSISSRFVWDHLGEDEREVLYNILGPSARNWAVRDDLPKKVPLPADRYKAALDRLKRHLLVFEVLAKVQGNQLVDHRLGFYAYGNERKLPVQAVDILYVPMEIANFLYATGREYFVPQSDRSHQSLEKILAPLYQGDLDEIARRYGIDLDGGYYTRGDYRAMLAASIVHYEAVSYALQQLDPIARNVFTLLCERGGKLSIQSIREFTGFDDASISSLLHTLAHYALAFDTFSEQKHIVFVPIDMYKNLKEAPTESSGPKGLVTTSPPASVRPGETIILYDLATLVGIIHQQDIEPTKAGMVPKRIATKIDPLLHGSQRVGLSDFDEYTYLEMLIDIAQELGLIQLSRPSPRDVKQHYEPGPSLEQWSHQDATEQTRRLLQIWINSGHWGDVVGANFVDWFSGYVDAKVVRSSILSHVRTCNPQEWYTVASLVDMMRGRDPFALRPRQRGIPSLGYSKAGELRKHWDSCEKEIIIGSLSSSLHELGIVTLGYQKPHSIDVNRAEISVNPDAFMLTELGATVLSSESRTGVMERSLRSAFQSSVLEVPPSAQHNGHHSLVVQPNFELLLLQPDFPTLYQLLPFTQVNQVGMVSRLTLTRESALRAVAAGMSVEKMLQLLEEHSQKGVPQNVDYTLHDWVKLYKGANISQVILLEVSSEAVANEICSSQKLKELLRDFDLRRLGPCAIALNSNINLPELRRVLDKMGIAARIAPNSGPPTRFASTTNSIVTSGRRR